MTVWIAHVTLIGFLTFIIWSVLSAFQLKPFKQLVFVLGILLFVNATLEDISPLLNKITAYGSGGTFEIPANGPITQNYNPPYHHGIDIAIPEGTLIRSQGKGKVLEARWDDIYGQVVVVEYKNGLQALYAHNKDIVVRKGELTIDGSPIAYSGNTGRSNGPHLHYEIRKSGKAVNPFLYLEVP